MRRDGKRRIDERDRIEHLAGLFLQRHLAQQVVDTLVERRRGIFIDIEPAIAVEISGLSLCAFRHSRFSMEGGPVVAYRDMPQVYPLRRFQLSFGY